jgi:hypothetical protein
LAAAAPFRDPQVGLARPEAQQSGLLVGMHLTADGHDALPNVDDIFNLGTLGRNDTSATPMSDLFRDGIP